MKVDEMIQCGKDKNVLPSNFYFLSFCFANDYDRMSRNRERNGYSGALGRSDRPVREGVQGNQQRIRVSQHVCCSAVSLLQGGWFLFCELMVDCWCCVCCSTSIGSRFGDGCGRIASIPWSCGEKVMCWIILLRSLCLFVVRFLADFVVFGLSTSTTLECVGEQSCEQGGRRKHDKGRQTRRHCRNRHCFLVKACRSQHQNSISK